MNEDRILQEFSSLPAQAQQMVLDFIAFLKVRYLETGLSTEKPAAELRNDEFIGMWRDRADMADSSDWVRRLRQAEWR
jgi:hypothetical protein